MAFLPDPFPGGWEWPERLWPLLVEARAALAELGGTGKHLPNPNILLRPLQNREAQRSSSLEGTFTKPEEQLLFEIDPRYPKSREDPINALREVFNYSQALRLRSTSKMISSPIRSSSSSTASRPPSAGFCPGPSASSRWNLNHRKEYFLCIREEAYCML